MRTLSNDLSFLQKVCKPVTLKKGLEIGRELFKFLENYNRRYISKNGLGLSAIQLGIDAQVCVMLFQPRLVLINPVIVERSEDTAVSIEGCLSLPKVILPIVRNIWIRVEAENLAQPRVFGVDLSRVSGKTYEQAFSESACVQHEIDHACFGRLIIDYPLGK